MTRRIVFDEDMNELPEPLDAYLLEDAPPAPAPAAPLDIDALLASAGGAGDDAALADAIGGAQTDLALAAPPPVARPRQQMAPPQARPSAPGPDRELQDAQRSGRRDALIATVGRAFNQAFGSRDQDAMLADMQRQAPDRPVKELMQRRESADQRLAQQRRYSREDAETARMEQRRDPASPINQRFQESLRARFGDSLSPDVLAQMTVEDSEAMGLLGAAQAARERQALMEQQRGMELEDMQRQQEHQINLEGVRHSGDLEEIAARNAGRRRPGGTGGGRGATSGALAEAMRRRMAGQPVPPEVMAQLTPRDIGQLDNIAVPRAEQGLSPAQQAVEERARRSDMRGLGSDLSRAGVLEAQGVIDRAESALSAADDTGYRAAVAAPSFIPDAILPGRGGASLREALAQVRNITLKDRSGAAINNAEFNRLREELGSGALQSRDAVLRGLRRLRQIQRDHQATIEAGYVPETVDAYHGRRSERLGAAPASTQAPRQQGGGMVTVSNGRETLRIPASDLAEAQADGFRPVGGR